MSGAIFLALWLAPTGPTSADFWQVDQCDHAVCAVWQADPPDGVDRHRYVQLRKLPRGTGEGDYLRLSRGRWVASDESEYMLTGSDAAQRLDRLGEFLGVATWIDRDGIPFTVETEAMRARLGASDPGGPVNLGEIDSNEGDCNVW